MLLLLHYHERTLLLEEILVNTSKLSPGTRSCSTKLLCEICESLNIQYHISGCQRGLSACRVLVVLAVGFLFYFLWVRGACFWDWYRVYGFIMGNWIGQEVIDSESLVISSSLSLSSIICFVWYPSGEGSGMAFKIFFNPLNDPAADMTNHPI